MQYFKEIFGRETLTYSFCDNIPQWVQDAVYEAHNGSLPNDWVFGICKAAFDYAESEINFVDDLYDLAYEFADYNVDIYNKSIAQWYADNCNCNFIIEAEDELDDLKLQSKSVVETLKQLQVLAIKNIAYIVFKFIFDNQKQEKCINI